MTAQLANGGFKINPKVIVNKDDLTSEEIKSKMSRILEKKIQGPDFDDAMVDPGITSAEESNLHTPLFRNQENIKFVLEAMFASTNEVRGTSYSSRIEDKKYQFAGKTGTSQVKRITEAQRELDLDISQIPYEDRDHALYIAFGPYKNPRYAMSIFIEHGGSGGSTAAPMAKKLFKVVIDRHDEREKFKQKNINFVA
jgi:penicillin-binding protein 2